MHLSFAKTSAFSLFGTHLARDFGMLRSIFFEKVNFTPMQTELYQGIAPMKKALSASDSCPSLSFSQCSLCLRGEFLPTIRFTTETQRTQRAENSSNQVTTRRLGNEGYYDEL